VNGMFTPAISLFALYPFAIAAHYKIDRDVRLPGGGFKTTKESRFPYVPN
jgi:hypothetical protein